MTASPPAAASPNSNGAQTRDRGLGHAGQGHHALLIHVDAGTHDDKMIDTQAAVVCPLPLVPLRSVTMLTGFVTRVMSE
jgi:hypothetical protein